MKNEKVIGRLLLLEHIDKEEAIKMLGGFTGEEYEKVSKTIKGNIEELHRRFEDRTEKINDIEDRIKKIGYLKNLNNTCITYTYAPNEIVDPVTSNIFYTINDVNKF